MLRRNSWALGLVSTFLGLALSYTASAEDRTQSVLNSSKASGNFYLVEGQWRHSDNTNGKWYGSMQILNVSNPAVTNLTSRVHVVDADGNGQDMTFHLEFVHNETVRGFFDVKRQGEDAIIGSGYCAFNGARQEVCHYAIHSQDNSAIEETFVFGTNASSYEVFGSRTAKDADGKIQKTVWAGAGRQRSEW